MITWYWFICPVGHTSLIEAHQAEQEPKDITCSLCGAHGGTLGETYIGEDYMSALKG